MFTKLLILAFVATTLSYAYRIEDPGHTDEKDLGKAKENYNKVLEELKGIVNKVGSEEFEQNPHKILQLIKEKKHAERKLRANVPKTSPKDSYDKVLHELEFYIKKHGTEEFMKNPAAVLKDIKEMRHHNKESKTGNTL